jgi:hypothetical protein
MAAEPRLDPLSNEELCFFKTYGYLIKRRVLDETDCADAIDRMWQTAPASIKRDNPSTWGPVPLAERSDDPLLVKQHAKWQHRAEGTAPWMLKLAFHPQVVFWAEQLLGKDSLRQPVPDGKPMGSWGLAWPGGPVDPQLTEGVRGIYATLPDLQAPIKADQLHTDGHPFHLGVVGLLQDCPADGGAFKIWPGSHRRFYPLFPMQYDQARVPFYPHLPSHKGIVHPPAYLQAVDEVEAGTAPVDCYGRAGDIVFWHHRMGHMAGINRAQPPTIRQALLFDFSKTELDTMRLDPPQENMWRDWSEELQQADIPITKQLAAEQRRPVGMTEPEFTKTLDVPLHAAP